MNDIVCSNSKFESERKATTVDIPLKVVHIGRWDQLAWLLNGKCAECPEWMNGIDHSPRVVKGFLRDAWFEQLLARDTWKQLKSRRDSWIDGPAWSVIREKPKSINVIRDLRGKKARDSWLGPPLYHPVPHAL